MAVKKKPQLNDSEATAVIAKHFREIMKALNLDLSDDSLKDTPNRVAKMYVTELCHGLRNEPPKCTVFKNKFPRNKIVLERDITVRSLCEHHFVPIMGICHIAYIPKHKVLGLSKFHRIVDYFATRPQLQERLTENICEFLKNVLETDDVAVIIKAKHLCCSMRGVKDLNSETLTSSISGSFMKVEARTELFDLLKI